MKDREAKVVWFKLLTGCSEEDARKFLELGKWKMKQAKIERRRYWDEKFRNEQKNG
jgi:hypothetical protein